MNVFLTANQTALQDLSMSESVTTGLQMLLMGMGVVFSVLIVICLLLILFRGMIHGFAVRSPKEAPAAPQPPATQASPNPNNDAELVAVITAAIAAANAEGGSKGFRVVSFKRINKNRR
ncbi:MAG: OadG family protein [Clostridia bacterium]|nr:OadG family protein [Clostridia bacterium]